MLRLPSGVSSATSRPPCEESELISLSSGLRTEASACRLSGVPHGSPCGLPLGAGRWVTSALASGPGSALITVLCAECVWGLVTGHWGLAPVSLIRITAVRCARFIQPVRSVVRTFVVRGSYVRTFINMALAQASSSWRCTISLRPFSDLPSSHSVLSAIPLVSEFFVYSALHLSRSV